MASEEPGCATMRRVAHAAAGQRRQGLCLTAAHMRKDSCRVLVPLDTSINDWAMAGLQLETCDRFKHLHRSAR
jgi:rhodanese-related sulfurtransferase